MKPVNYDAVRARVKPFVDVKLADAAVDPVLRAKLLHATLTIHRAYICADCPLGTDDLARHALVWLGQPDPGPSPDPITLAEYKQLEPLRLAEYEQLAVQLTGRRPS